MTGYTKQVTDEELKETINKISENLDSTKELDKWVVYPDVPFDLTIEEYKSIINMQEKNEILNPLNPFIGSESPVELPSNLIPYTSSAMTTTAGFFDTKEELVLEEVDPKEILDDDEPVFENPLPEDGEEQKELTDEEKRELYIQQLKASKIRFQPIKHFVKKIETKTTITQPFGGSYHVTKTEKTENIVTNITTNQFSADYRKKRRSKNKLARASRKANRK